MQSDSRAQTTTTPTLSTGQFRITPQGPYALAASARFLEGFGPANHPGERDGHLHLALVVDGSEQAVGVCIRAEDGVVIGDMYGEADSAVVEKQVARILSLDIDGTAFPEVGQRDPVIGELQRRYPGLRPVCFFSPFEAAAWAIIGHRIRIMQAAAVKARMAAQLGAPVNIHGEVWNTFPGPTRLAELAAFPGLFGRKAEWLRELGVAAQRGDLDADRLRAMPVNDALISLKRLPGIGDFGAQLILLRGAGSPDTLPSAEPRLQKAVQLVYGLSSLLAPEEIAKLAEPWRPFRTWVSLLLRVALEEETGEMAGRKRVTPTRSAPK